MNFGLPAKAFTTHTILSPQDRTIVAACEQVGCLRWRNGWDTPVDERTPEGRFYAELIRSGRHRRTYRELARTADGLTVFRFAAYQRCFQEHRTRPELYVAGVGDGPQRRHARPDDWTEDLHEALDRRLTSIERG